MFEKIEKFYQNLNSKKWFAVVVHILILTSLLLMWLPIARIFNDSYPPLGVDYYQFASYLNTLDHDFRLPPLSWRPDWFMGQPLIFDHPWLHVYLALPFAKIFGLFMGANIYSLLTLFLFFVFTYFATYQISRNKLLAGFLSAALLWVNSLYVPLYSGGNTAFSSTLFFLPLIIWMIFKYYQGGQRRYFYAASLFQGLAFLAHPGTALFFILGPAIALLFLYSDEKVKFFSGRKIKDIFLFLLVAALIGGPLLYILIKLYTELVSFGKETGEGKEVADTFSSLPVYINLLIFAPLGLAIFSALFSRKFWRKFQRFIPFIITFIYIFVFEWLYYIGKNPLRGNILPPRTFWLISLAAVFSLAIFWTNIFRSKGESSDILGRGVKIFIIIFQILVIGGLGYLAYPQKSAEKMLAPTIASEVKMRSFADAHPAWLVHQALKKGDTADLNKALPKDLDLNSYAYRLHSLTPGFNIWWNIINKPPLTHGYYDSRSRQQQDWSYWMDTAIAGELTYRYDQPLIVSKNSALFLIDWLAIKYLEGHEVDAQTGDIINLPPGTINYGSITQLASYLLSDPAIVKQEADLTQPDYLEKELGGKVPVSMDEFLNRVDWLASYGLANPEDLSTSESIKPMTDEQVRQQLKKEGWADFWVNMDFLAPDAYPVPPIFKEVNDEYVSPITNYSNAPTLYLAGDPEGYNNFIRVLGAADINSKNLVPVRGQKNINRLSEKELESFDAIGLYLYDNVSAKTWDKLFKYVEKGGKLFIDTGSQQAESSSRSLPAVFPVADSRRDSLGSDWNVTEKADVFKDIDINKFDNLTYEGADWNLSSAAGVKDGAQALLSQDNQVILASQIIGQGKVTWSGMNLPFRINYYHNAEELELFEIVMNDLLVMDNNFVPSSTLVRNNGESLKVSGPAAKGVIFRENFDKGWQSEVKSGQRKEPLKIYPAGPDMMYVNLPAEADGELVVSFNYRGSGLAWFFYLISLITIILMILLAIFGHHLARFSKKSIKAMPLTNKVTSWWAKDDE